MLIDTHAHLFWSDFRDDLAVVLKRAKAVGVKKIVVPAVNAATAEMSLSLAKQYPAMLAVAVGIHPEEIERKGEREIAKEIEELEEKIKANKVVAMGEVGLDFHTEELRQKRQQQLDLFRKMVRLAQKWKLPVIIHSRESVKEVLTVLEEVGWWEGVCHCFSGNEAELREVLERGLRVSFCGNISWSKRVARLVKLVPTERLLLETDSPFMTPRDEKGQVRGGSLRNEPKNVRILAELYASLKKESLEKIAKVTSQNAQELFKI